MTSRKTRLERKERAKARRRAGIRMDGAGFVTSAMRLTDAQTGEQLWPRRIYGIAEVSQESVDASRARGDEFIKP